MSTPARLALFIDYQNVYMRAREAFGLTGEPSCVGQVHPVKLGRLVAAAHRVGDGARLERVQLYRGLPDAHRDGRGHAAARRQIAAWESDPLVSVHARPLRYPPPGRDEKPREKGVDVKLAIDFVECALNRAADILVLFSADTDLVPALELVYDRYPTLGVRVMSAAWKGGNQLHLKRPGFWCFKLERKHFDVVKDDTDYNVG